MNVSEEATRRSKLQNLRHYYENHPNCDSLFQILDVFQLLQKLYQLLPDNDPDKSKASTLTLH